MVLWIIKLSKMPWHTTARAHEISMINNILLYTNALETHAPAQF